MIPTTVRVVVSRCLEAHFVGAELGKAIAASRSDPEAALMACERNLFDRSAAEAFRRKAYSSCVWAQGAPESAGVVLSPSGRESIDLPMRFAEVSVDLSQNMGAVLR